MLCSTCRKEIAEESNFCYYCGARQSVSSGAGMHSQTGRKRLMRSATDCKVAGVCAGVAEYLDVDATIVRLIWVALSLVPGLILGGIVVYVLAWIIMPKAPLPRVSAPAQSAAQPSVEVR